MTCLGSLSGGATAPNGGALKQFKGTVHGAHGKPLQIAGRTQHLNIQWGEASGRASFIVIVGLESPPCLIGLDIMRPLRVHIDVPNCIATPAQPNTQTVHLDAAQSQQRCQEMPLPGAGLHPSQATNPPPTQPQQSEKPLPEAGSPTMGTASPPQIPQPREEIPLPRAQLSPVGAADSFRIQPQRKEIPLPWSRDVSSSPHGDSLPSRHFAQRTPTDRSTVNCPIVHRHSSHR